MKTTFNKLKEGDNFYIMYSSGRSIFYQKHTKQGNNAIIISLDYYKNLADRQCIGNAVTISSLQIVYKTH